MSAELSSCILLAGPVTHDGRVQRIARTLGDLGPVLLVTAGGSQGDQELFPDRVEVRPTARQPVWGARRWFLLHRQYDHLAKAALREGRAFQLVWANDYSTLFPAIEIARAVGARVVYDSHEIWLETVNQFFPTDVSPFKKLAFRVIIGICRAIGKVEEPRLAAGADAILTVNESCAGVLSKRLRRPQVGVVLNCPERTALRFSDRIRRELELDGDDRIVLYQGNMNAGRGLHELVASAVAFPPGVRLLMLGDGMLKPSLLRAVGDAGLEDRVFMRDPVPHAELPEWTASADLGVLILDPINLSKRLALANKVFEYMAAGIPMLATDLPENRRIVEQCDCGWLISGTAPSAIAAKIADILASPEEMKRRGANGRRWFEQRYNWGVESEHVLAMVRGLMSQDA